MSVQVEPLRETEQGRLVKGPVVLVVMDGVACGPDAEDNAVYLAHTPTLDHLRTGLWTELCAHGLAVGMPSDSDMGNSEVGHNALGAGRVFAQGARLVEEAVQSGRLFEGEAWKQAVQRGLDGGAMHFMGLLSDGNVHSHDSHLHAMIHEAAKAGVTRVFAHILTDGRDVPETSALTYVERLEEVLSTSQPDGGTYRIASGGGRMVITMDRYEAEWEMVRRGWETHVKGEGERFASAAEAIETLRERHEVNDQYLPPFVIADQDGPVGTIQDGDAVLFVNFRGDRAIEMSCAFTEDDFPYFDRGERPDVFFAGMMQYDGDRLIPQHFLVDPPAINRTMGEFLAANGIGQFAISETQKYGHVTYFWNGNRSDKFDEELETYVEVSGDPQPFEQRPWMKAAEITDKTIEAIESGKYGLIRLNFPNGDMVGHTGSLQAAILSVEVVDLCVARLLRAVEKADGVALVTADHGNADEMWERNKDGSYKRDEKGRPKPKTSHSLRPVPFAIHARPEVTRRLQMASIEKPGLSHVAATALRLLGLEPPEEYDPALVTIV